MDTANKKHAAASNDGKFSYESVQDTADLVRYLRALTDGFEKGSIHFSRKDNDITLSPKGLVNFLVEAKAKDGRMKLNLKFAWRETPKASDLDEGIMTIETGNAS